MASFFAMKTQALILVMSLLAGCGQQSTEAEQRAVQLEAASKTPPYERIPLQTTRLTGGGVVRSARGALVSVPKEGLLTAEGKPYTGPCEVRLREATTAAEFVQFGLTTAGEDGILESGGMLEITATDTADRPLQLNPDFGWAVSMPVHAAPALVSAAENDSGGWKIFKGSRNERGEMTWGELQAEPEISKEELAFLLEAKKFLEKEAERSEEDPFGFGCSFESKKAVSDALKRDKEAIETYKRSKRDYIFTLSFRDLCHNSIKIPNFMSNNAGKEDALLTISLTVKNKKYGSYSSEYGESEKKSKRKNDCLTVHYNLVDHDMITTEVEACDVTEQYEKLTAWYKKVAGRKDVQDSLKKYERNVSQQQRLHFVISQFGWYNVDRYAQSELFAASFSVEGLDSAYKRFLHLSLLQPSVNVHMSCYFGANGYEAKGVSGHPGFIIAWVDGVSVGSLAFTANQTRGGATLGNLKLEAVSETRIDELIRQLIAEGKPAPA